MLTMTIDHFHPHSSIKVLFIDKLNIQFSFDVPLVQPIANGQVKCVKCFGKLLPDISSNADVEMILSVS